MKMTKMIIMVLFVLCIVLSGCECEPCNPCNEVSFVDTSMVSHVGCVRPELYNSVDNFPVCIPNYNYTLAGFNLDCELSNESMVDEVYND